MSEISFIMKFFKNLQKLFNLITIKKNKFKNFDIPL